MRICALLLLVSTAFGQSDAKTISALKNGGFEVLTSGRADAPPESWEWRAHGRFTKEPVAGLEVVPAAARSGRNGLKMAKGIGPRVVAQQNLVLPADLTGWFEVSAWARTASDKPAIGQIKVIAESYGVIASFTQPNPNSPAPFRNNGRLRGVQSDEMFLTGGWQRISFAFFHRRDENLKAPSAIRLQLIGWPLEDDIWWDDVEIKFLGEIELSLYKSPADGQLPPNPFYTAPSPTVPGAFRVERSTHHAVGFEWEIQGDYNRNGSVEVTYRKVGAAEWKKGMPLHRLMYEVVDRDEWEGHPSWATPNMYAGSILNLEPGTKYEVRLTLKDPDGGAAEKSVVVATRPWPILSETGRSLHVYPPGFAGKREEPSFIGLRAAYAEAQPGDAILVHAGRYVVPEKEEIGRCAYIMNKKATLAHPIVIRAAGDGPAIFEGASNTLFNLDGAEYHYFDGLTLRDCDRFFYAGSGVGLVIQRCAMSESKYPIWLIGRTCRDFTIADNVIVGREPKEKGSHPIWISGQGHAICYNHIYSFWDGIDITGGYPPETPEERNCSIDIYGNLLHDFLDDCIEMDFGVHNIRVFGNLCYNAHVGISAQPLYGGPGYIFRNVVFNTSEPALKLNNWPAGLIIANNTFCGSLCSSAMWQNSWVYNNLIFSEGRGPIWTGTPTPETSRLDYNGLRIGKQPVLWQFFRPWKRDEKEYLNATYEPSQKAKFTRDTGYEAHSLWDLDYDIFLRASADFFKNLKYDRTRSAQENAVPLDAFDLRLRDGARVVDAGMELSDITDGFTGKAPDLGAYELGLPPPHYGPRPRPK